MKIPEINAFPINRLGSSPFPFSVDVSRKENVTSAFLCPQRVVDVCDIIEKYSGNNLVLFKVAQYYAISLQQIATNANIPFSAIDSETIVLSKEILKPLLSSFDHYDLFIIDVGNEGNEIDVIGHVITCLEHDWRSQELLLPKLPASDLFIHSHDDCYLSIETHNPSIVLSIFGRALQIYAATLLAQKSKIQFEVPEIP